ncbi:hypothetical protein TSUD_104230 [Trifolium subterraneum]|uniref:Nuclear cap-binding protein subunit 2 n=1 Tax=Trifolium subterraneum TaxID=3900 RepID=A0A2Z6M3M9_TRISU|nr:hypothetical protein TSUD_104230 [Trifolium subterraneum]
MASLFKDPAKISAYRDRRFPGNQEEFEHALITSTTVYVGNMSFYTTEEQIYELFSRAGEIKKIIMGLDKNTKTPCGVDMSVPASCPVSGAVSVLNRYYSREDTEDACKYISGTILDDRPIRVDFDWGFQDGRQWGRGRSGGQKELEVQRHLVDYGTGSLGSFPPVIPSSYGRHGGGHGHGGGYGHGGSRRHGRDYPRKRYRDDDRHNTHEPSKRSSDHESRRNSDHESRPVNSTNLDDALV